MARTPRSTESSPLPSSRRRRHLLTAGAVAAALALVSACGSSGSGSGTSSGSGNSSGSGGSSSGANGQIFSLNGGGTPVKGGTLTMLGTGDVDYMDPNISYFTTGYLALRMFSRSLYTYPAVQGQTTTLKPDLATGPPQITDGGKTYTVTLRSGVDWDTSPARAVTAADVVRGIKRTCNPTEPFGGQPDYSALIVGFQQFCDGFGKVSTTDANAQKQYLDSNQISGVTASTTNPEQLQIQLTQPTAYFADELGLHAFDPAPVEYENYLPASNQQAQNTISDGPYKVASYNPGKSIDFVRNPVWKASTDPIRKAYVNEIKVNETGNAQSIEQQIATNSSAADMGWDTEVPNSAIPQLISSKNPDLILASESGTDPYLIFNTVSPNNNSALKNTEVRQALEYGINRQELDQNGGGPNVSPALTHILPPGINGSVNSDPYPYNPTKAKQLLAKAGFANGLNLKLLYRPAESSVQSADFQTIQADLSKIGVKVTGDGVPNADFFTKYLEVPSTARSGVWDISLATWFPDWYGDAAASFFNPLFDGRVSPPTSSNFGLFNDPTVNADIDKALAATTSAQSAPLWQQADKDTMAGAAIFPVTDPNYASLTGSQVHNRVFLSYFLQVDPTNVWLNK